MVARAKGWKLHFQEGLAERLRSPADRTAFVKAMTEATKLSPQAIYKWLARQQISDENLHFGLDYVSLRLYGTFVPAGYKPPEDGRRRRRSDSVHEAAQGYEVPLPTGAQMAARWDRLPSAVKGFLLAQIESIEGLHQANPELARLMFSAPNGDGYKKWEASVTKSEARKPRS